MDFDLEDFCPFPAWGRPEDWRVFGEVENIAPPEFP
jgi:hypothetical protein